MKFHPIPFLIAMALLGWCVGASTARADIGVDSVDIVSRVCVWQLGRIWCW